MDSSSFNSHLLNLEHILVRQFRLLQKLIETSQAERDAMIQNSPALTRLIEDKEVALDQLGLLDDERRQTVQDMAVMLGLPAQACSIRDLQPYISGEDGDRVQRLAEGITALVEQSRELNCANQALAYVKIDLVKATQTFLINLAQPDIDYRPPGSLPIVREATSWGVECRA